MKKTTIRILSLFILLLAMTNIIVGCSGNTSDYESLSILQPADTDLASSVDIIKNSTPQVRIVRGENASEAEKEAAISIRKAIAAFCSGSAPLLTTDFSKDGMYDPSVAEIIVGRTDCPETVAALDSISYGEFIISVSGNKIIVAAPSEAAAGIMAEKFIKLLGERQSQDGTALTLNESDGLVEVYNENLKKLPTFYGALPDIITYSGDLAHQVVISKTTEELYNNYSMKLESVGFKKQSEHSAAGNLSAVYTDDESSVITYFTPLNSTMRIIIEPVSNLFTGEENSFIKLTQPKLVMIGRNFGSGTDNPAKLDASSGLMCFVIQLSDGRYIVIDGGVATDFFAQGIYSVLLTNALDKENITVAAWIITHSHTDHIGGFCRFSELYSSKVHVERFLYNFPSEADAKAFGEDVSIRRVSEHISSYYPDAAVNKVHSGQTFRIADAEIEIYYTVENYVKSGRTLMSTKNYNLSSLIFSIDIADQRIMFLGDAQEDSNNMTAAMYGSYLKSDFVQVAHHGGEGGTNSIYKAIDPEIALFTTSDALLPVYLEYSYNSYLINKLNIKEYYNSANRIKTWILPYQATSSGFIR